MISEAEYVMKAIRPGASCPFLLVALGLVYAQSERFLVVPIHKPKYQSDVAPMTKYDDDMSRSMPCSTIPTRVEGRQRRVARIRRRRDCVKLYSDWNGSVGRE
jgi:hypothetical protein